MLKYVVVIEKAPDGGYGGYVPDLPGCIGMGHDYDSALENTIEAIQFHLEGMKVEGFEIPFPTTKSETILFADV